MEPWCGLNVKYTPPTHRLKCLYTRCWAGHADLEIVVTLEEVGHWRWPFEGHSSVLLPHFDLVSS